ncbi:CRISPR system precrRNA processing endoribonuclease RAMP protein Cas6 [Methylobacter sp. BlB1]|uniref:CRISPR system precrRNA processing endoribonuclease RAMP protein Cas6 n=1 Tax=Methylobacter sp. BlB1 TaxID=2785914 RepID=UPI00351ACDF1
MIISQPVIPIKTYRFYFATDGVARLPNFPGSAWRGAFGHALKKTVCVVRGTPCSQCMLKSACAYSYVFETPPPANAGKMRKYNAAPHPFVLQFPEASSVSGSTYALDVILFGHGQRYLPYIVHALQTAGNDGIGGHQQIFSLQKIDDIDPEGVGETIYQHGELKSLQSAGSPTIPAMPDCIEIAFHTPLRIKQDSKNLTARQFNFGAFFGTLLRRISMISYFHTDAPLETDFAALTAKARTVQFASQQLKWFDWTRYSSRQQTEMNMGGLIGRVHLDMQGLEDFWPYLWLGQWTHAGKGTSMGMGAYTIQPTSLSVQ